MSHPNKLRQRANKRKGKREDKLDTKNSFNIFDPTPWKAVNNMRNEK